MNNIVVIDFGMGNLRSVEKVFERLNKQVTISSDIRVIEAADKLILPGVGNFTSGMEHINERGLKDVISNQVLKEGKSILGICLGMQLLTQQSEEGNTQGIGFIAAETKKFIFTDNSYKVPHIGWNSLNLQKENDLTANQNDDDLFYFVHSYYVECRDKSEVISTTAYGNQTFVSAFQKENIFGVQFHPEKSHKAGLQLLKNFIELI